MEISGSEWLGFWFCRVKEKGRVKKRKRELK